MIKVEVDEAENGARKYPYFGKFDDGVVILFIGSSEGIVVSDPKGMSQMWHYAENWYEHRATPLPKGTKITLTQE